MRHHQGYLVQHGSLDELSLIAVITSSTQASVRCSSSSGSQTDAGLDGFTRCSPRCRLQRAFQ